MNVVIADEAWGSASSAWRQGLVELITQLVARPFHPLSAEPSAAEAWAREHMPSFVEEVRALIARDGAIAGAVELRVHPEGTSELTADPPWCVSAAAAAKLIARPLRLVLENEEHDQRFLRALSGEVGALVSGTDRGLPAVQVVHGGGSRMMRQIVDAGKTPDGRYRHFFLFDSDRLHPEEHHVGWSPPKGDGCQGYENQQRCRQAGLPTTRYYQLRRRSIENYLPQPVLVSVSAAAAQVLGDSDVGDMRWYYNMKQGTDGDGITANQRRRAVKARRAGGFWAGLSPQQRAPLQQGFGSDVASRFNGLTPASPWDPEAREEGRQIVFLLRTAV